MRTRCSAGIGPVSAATHASRAPEPSGHGHRACRFPLKVDREYRHVSGLLRQRQLHDGLRRQHPSERGVPSVGTSHNCGDFSGASSYEPTRFTVSVLRVESKVTRTAGRSWSARTRSAHRVATAGWLRAAHSVARARVAAAAGTRVRRAGAGFHCAVAGSRPTRSRSGMSRFGMRRSHGFLSLHLERARSAGGLPFTGVACPSRRQAAVVKTRRARRGLLLIRSKAATGFTRPCRSRPAVTQVGGAVQEEGPDRKSLTESGRIEQMARLAGIEPTTLGFGGQYSIH